MSEAALVNPERVLPVLRHRRSRLLYVGTTRRFWRLLLGGWQEGARGRWRSNARDFGPTRFRGRKEAFELVGAARSVPGFRAWDVLLFPDAHAILGREAQHNT